MKKVMGIFLFLMIFINYNVKKEYQERVLLYGVLAAMILRLLFILLGVKIIKNFEFVLSLFGFVLLYKYNVYNQAPPHPPFRMAGRA